MQLPHVLSLVLNRFERRADGGAAGKRTTAVFYPATLNLTEESTPGSKHTRTYELVAVSYHVSETKESGHYKATCSIHTSSCTTTVCPVLSYQHSSLPANTVFPILKRIVYCWSGCP